MNWIKIIYINLTVTLALLFLLMVSPPILYTIYMSSKAKPSEVAFLHGVDLTEVKNLSMEYKDFIVWRRNDYSSESINIKNGVRNTPTINVNLTTSAWFFGGSTTWGYGVADDKTYPYYVGEKLNTKVVNFGETGYIARQSLAFLQNILLNDDSVYGLPDKVIFYDGVNDVGHRCRSEINGLATGWEAYIQNKLNDIQEFSFAATFEQLLKFTELVSNKLFLTSERQINKYASEYYNCSSDIEKAKNVARTLVSTWKAAELLAKSVGAEFVAVLQPHAFSNPNALKDIRLGLAKESQKALMLQFETVYPLIKMYAKESNINFVDMSDALDDCKECYFDFCHLNPTGNEIVANIMLGELY